MNWKDIVLKWFDRKLNPDWAKKFIWSLFSLGAILVISPIVVSVIDVSISHGELEFKAAFAERTNSIWEALAPFIGVVIIFIAAFLFKIKLNDSETNKSKLLDIDHIGNLTFCDMENPEMHKLYFENKNIINIGYRNPNYNYKHKHKHKQLLVSGGSDCIWSEFIQQFPEVIQPYIMEIRKEIVKTELIKLTGQDMNNTVFEFIDGVTFLFSWRAWGEMVQAIGYQRDGYMEHYM